MVVDMRIRQRRRLLPALALPLLVLAPADASAHPLLELFGGLGPTNPLSGRLLATGGEAAYFAPALLPDLAEDMTFSLFALSQNLDIALSRRHASSDVGEEIYRAWVPDANGIPRPIADRPLPTSKLDDRQTADGGPLGTYVSVGMVKHFVPRYLSLGFIAVLPMGTFQQQTALYPDEREQYFSNGLGHELYGDRLNMMTLAGGLGGDLTGWLSWGSGVTLGLSTTTINPVYVPNAANHREILITSDTSVDTSLAPHASLALRPSDSVLVTASVHSVAKTVTSGTNRLKFWDYDYDDGEDAVVQQFAFVNGYEPLTLGAGARLAFPSETPDTRLLVAADLRWRAWSGYIDRVGLRPTTPWSDTLSATLGARYEAPELTLSLDAAWTPSPVPPQTGRENYVDNDRLGVAAGLESRFDLFGVRLRAGLGVQIHRLLEAAVVKDPNAPNPVRDEFPDNAVDPLTGDNLPGSLGIQSNNPGYPGYASSGWLLGASLSLKVDL